MSVPYWLLASWLMSILVPAAIWPLRTALMSCWNPNEADALAPFGGWVTVTSVPTPYSECSTHAWRSAPRRTADVTVITSPMPRASPNAMNTACRTRRRSSRHRYTQNIAIPPGHRQPEDPCPGTRSSRRAALLSSAPRTVSRSDHRGSSPPPLRQRMYPGRGPAAPPTAARLTGPLAKLAAYIRLGGQLKLGDGQRVTPGRRPGGRAAEHGPAGRSPQPGHPPGPEAPPTAPRGNRTNNNSALSSWAGSLPASRLPAGLAAAVTSRVERPLDADVPVL